MQQPCLGWQQIFFLKDETPLQPGPDPKIKNLLYFLNHMHFTEYNIEKKLHKIFQGFGSGSALRKAALIRIRTNRCRLGSGLFLRAQKNKITKTVVPAVPVPYLYHIKIYINSLSRYGYRFSINQQKIQPNFCIYFKNASTDKLQGFSSLFIFNSFKKCLKQDPGTIK